MIRTIAGRVFDASKPVRVYRNLRRSSWSLVQGRRVVAHADGLILRDARTVVSKAGCDRSNRLGRRSVFAWVEGLVAESAMGCSAEVPGRWPAQVLLDRNRCAFVSAVGRREVVGGTFYLAPDGALRGAYLETR